MTPSQNVYVVAQREYTDMTGEDGGKSIISVHADLRTANKAAQLAARAYRFEWPDDFDYVSTEHLKHDGGLFHETETPQDEDRTCFQFEVYTCLFSGQLLPQSATAQKQEVYIATRRDFDEFDVEDGWMQILSVHSELQAANCAAQSARSQELLDRFDAEECVIVEKTKVDGGFFHQLDVPNGEYESRTQFEVKPHILYLPPSPPPAALFRITNSYGQMVTIPEGNRLLRGAKFFFTGRLASIDRETAKEAVRIYGGFVASHPLKADYAVVGESPAQERMATIGRLRIERATEGLFFTLLKHGIPNGKILQHERLQDLSSNTPTPAVRRTAEVAGFIGAGQENAIVQPAKRLRY